MGYSAGRSTVKTGTRTVPVDKSTNKTGNFSVGGTVIVAGISGGSGSYQGGTLSVSWSGSTISYTLNDNAKGGYGFNFIISYAYY